MLGIGDENVLSTRIGIVAVTARPMFEALTSI
jgi:hypothetical protein